jgi:hypothetical protein
MTRVVLGAIVAVLVALLVGWIWGASGTSTLERSLQAAELRINLLEARSAVLGARVDLYSVNFGDAIRHLEEGREYVRRAITALQGSGREAEAKQLEPAATSIDEARQLAGKLDQGAQSPVAEAVKTIGAALERSPMR